MVDLPLGRGIWKRDYAKDPIVELLNRFFEQDPANRDDGVDLLGRPGSTFLAGCGEGPIRANFTRDGCFAGSLFTVSGPKLFAFAKNKARTDIIGTINGGTSTPRMDGTDKFMWIVDGTLVQFWDGVGSRAFSTYTMTAIPIDGDTVTVGLLTYTYKTVVGVPYTVLIGATINDSLTNLADAINRDQVGDPEGTRYGLNTQQNPLASATNNGDNTLRATARTGGAAGNTVATTSVSQSVPAKGTLSYVSGTMLGTKVQIDGVYYFFNPTGVGVAGQLGTVGNPWCVNGGTVFAPLTVAQCLANIVLALNATGIAGTDYGTPLTAHPTVKGLTSDATHVFVQARTSGTGGNALSTTVTAGTAVTWGGATLSGGTAAPASAWSSALMVGGVTGSLSGVDLPDDIPMVDVAVLDGYTFFLQANTNLVFWIPPGQFTIDPLNFIIANTDPSPSVSLRRVGDQLWVMKSETIIPYEITSDPAAVIQPILGRAFSLGVQQGTDVVILGSSEVVLVGNDNKVYAMAGEPKRISHSGIEELIRRARKIQRGF